MCHALCPLVCPLFLHLLQEGQLAGGVGSRGWHIAYRPPSLRTLQHQYEYSHQH